MREQPNFSVRNFHMRRIRLFALLGAYALICVVQMENTIGTGEIYLQKTCIFGVHPQWGSASTYFFVSLLYSGRL